MKSRDIPFVSAVLEAGADDRVFDSLLLTGPLVIGLVVVLGRSLVTEAVAIAYIAAFVGHTLYRGVRT
ncbi:hypothetical protein [Halobellus captivus]|uniref:hypothetical protein n=1 Tax=Halobellus captivus TaxID=2592614 RepID=UPI00119E372D|nr:hypothetical protein [Halobellus captivus]